jgi:HSP20 family protein
MAIIRRFGWPTTWRERGFDDLESIRRQMDRLFEGLAGWPSRELTAGVFPLTNVTEDKDNYYVRSELPGMAADELDISMTGDALSISGERKIPAEEADAKYHRREREAGRFSRVISLPGHIDTEKAEASCTDGVLTVVVPKAEAAKPRQISVRTAS